jgi:hypothetical protein
MIESRRSRSRYPGIRQTTKKHAMIIKLLLLYEPGLFLESHWLFMAPWHKPILYGFGEYLALICS